MLVCEHYQIVQHKTIQNIVKRLVNDDVVACSECFLFQMILILVHQILVKMEGRV